MFSAHLLDLKAIPEPLMVNTAIPELKKQVFPQGSYFDVRAEFLGEEMGRVEHDIILNILDSDIEHLQSDIEEQIIPFQSELYKINSVMLGDQRKEEIPMIAEIEEFLFEQIRRFIENNIPMAYGVDVKNAVLRISQQLKNYDDTVLGIIYTEIVSLTELLKATDTSVLRKYVSGSVLVFLCILSFVQKKLWTQ